MTVIYVGFAIMAICAIVALVCGYAAWRGME